MKKLMIAAAIVCAAVVSQAANCDWSVSYIYDYSAISAPTPSYDLANNYATYFVVATDTFGVNEMKAALAESDFSWMDTLKNQTSVSPMTGGAASNSMEGFGNEETIKGFMVIFNDSDYAKADYAYVSDAQTKTTGGEGQPAGMSFGEYNSYLASNWTKIESVPEPTSGLLLLLGVAGLALRRRRA